MPNAEQLLSVARELVDHAGTTTILTIGPADAHLRRAVSTAYYALFHKVVGAAAGRLVGTDQLQTAAYRLVYRAYDHRRMKDVFTALQAPVLKPPYQDRLGRSSVSQDLRNVAIAFVTLQEARQLADYHPGILLLLLDAAALVNAAIQAVASFDRVPPDELRDVLALMLVGARA